VPVFRWVRVSHKEKLVFEAAVEVSRPPSRCSSLLSRCEAAEVVESAVEVFEAAVEVCGRGRGVNTASKC
jgi:hypothetical protein